MKLESYKVGPIQTNCYIVQSDNELIVVDPGDDLERILEAIDNRPVKAIVVTHAHWDHIGALSGLAKKTGACVYASEPDAALIEGVSNQNGYDLDRGYGAPHIDVLLQDGDEISFGHDIFEVLATPGHSSGSICLYNADNKILLSGDTLFAGGRFGRTDFEHGSMQQMIETLQTKFTDIPDDVSVYPGHESFSTMGVERSLNPYLV